LAGLKFFDLLVADLDALALDGQRIAVAGVVAADGHVPLDRARAVGRGQERKALTAVTPVGADGFTTCTWAS